MSKRFGARRRPRRARPILEGLEPRILMSADLPGLDTLASTTEDRYETDVDQVLADAEAAFGRIGTEAETDAADGIPSSETESARASRELVIVDPNVPDYEIVLAELSDNRQAGAQFDVVLLDSERDGVDQLSEILTARTGLDALHLISHGGDGTLQLGDQTLDISRLEQEAAVIRSWGDALSAKSDILIYGCNLAATDAGVVFIDTLSGLTGADVAASDDLTGHARFGGDWDLEYQVGDIEADLALVQQLRTAWDGVLDIASNRVIHQNFDADASDSSGNSHDGTLIDDAAIDTSTGTIPVGTGKLSLDGSNDYVDLSAHVGAVQNLTQGTISAWIYAESNGFESVFSASDSGDNESRISVIRDDGILSFVVEDAGSAVLEFETNASVSPRDAWIHVAVTVDGTGNKLYVNGAQITNLTYLNGSASSTGFFDDVGNLDFMAWGANKSDGSSIDEFFEGAIDDGRVYDRALSAADVLELYQLAPPSDLQTVATTDGGLSLNQDSGNDAYLIADDGGAIMGGMTELTAEVRFSMDSFQNSTNFFSYATAGDDNVFKFNIRDNGELSVSVNSSKINSSAMDFRTLADGAQHTLSVTWSSSGGLWEMFVDGVSVDSGSSLQTGASLAAGGALVIGNDQDSVDGGYDPAAEARATLYDARIFDVVRTDTQIKAGYASTLPFDESGLVANWTFDDLSTGGVVTDTVSGNNLTVQHASGAGFISSQPVLTLSIDENALDGTVVGNLSGTDPEREALIASLLALDSDLAYSAETEKFYKVISGSFDWTTAKSSAESTALGGTTGQLAVIRSATENAYLTQLANTHTGGNSVWLGGTDQTLEGDWRWIESGSEADRFWSGGVDGYASGSYANWVDGSQPNNLGGAEDAMRLDSSSGLWYDAPTTGSNHSYIVEWNADDVLDVSQALTYSIQSQTVAGAFEIDPDSGEIRVLDGMLLDAETFSLHNLTVRVTDVDGLTYDEAVSITLNDLADVAHDNAPTDLSSGIELNADGGNDAYLQAADGGGLLGGLSALTLETVAQIDTPMAMSPIFSYETGPGGGSGDNALLLAVADDGTLYFGINGTLITEADLGSPLLDGEAHHVAASWSAENGSVALYIDGEFVKALDSIATGTSVAGGGVLLFGQEQDDAGSDFQIDQVFKGTLYDVRVWNEVRSEGEISLNWQQKFDSGSLPNGLIANWQMDGFNGSNEVVDVVSGNNLSVGHAAGAGFTASTPVEDLHVSENAGNGESVGYVVPSDPDLHNDLVSDGLFLEGDNGSWQAYNTGETVGAWTVVDGRVDHTSQHTSPLGGVGLELERGPGDPGGTISQTLTTEVGREYQIIFKADGNFSGGDPVKHMRVSAAGQSQDYQITDTGVYEQFSMRFVATDTSTDLLLQGLRDTGYGAVVSDVQVIEIPQAVSAILHNDSTLSYDAGTGKFYKVVTTGADFTTAMNNAVADDLNGVDGQLLTIRSAYENDYIRTLIEDQGAMFYLGATDATTEGEWNWIEEGAEADRFWDGGWGGSAPTGAYSNWYPGEPSESGGGEDRALIRESDGAWIDIDGTGSYGYIIEWDANEVLSNFTFSLTDDAGGRFAIDSITGEITVADGSQLDYETATSHNVTVEVTDAAGNTYNEVMSIAIDNGLDANQSVPGAQSVDEGQVLTFSSGNGNAVSVSDSVAATDSLLQVTLSVNDGYLTLSSLSGLTIEDGAQSSPTITVTGTETAINAALEGMTFTPYGDFSGAVTLDVTTSLAADLEGHYTFEGGSAADVSTGTAANGVLVGDATSTVDTERGQVLSLDGSGDYVEIDSTFGEPTAVTIGGWVNFSGAGRQEFISIDDRVHIALDDGGNGVKGSIQTGASSWNDLSSGTTLSGSGWHHVMYTYDDAGDTHSLYIDGQLAASESITDSVYWTGATTTYIGHHPTSGWDVDGMIDDARIYTRALSAEEVAALAADAAIAGDSIAITVNPINEAPSFTVGDGIVTDFGATSAYYTKDLMIQGDGKYVVVGVSNDGGNNMVSVSRFSEDGSLDTGFGAGGRATTTLGTSDTVNGGTLQPDGKILVVGATNVGSPIESAVWRFNADGSVDTSFGVGGAVTMEFSGTSSEYLKDVVVQPDGKIVVAGYANSGDEVMTIARLNADGSLDSSFNGGSLLTLDIGTGNDDVTAIAIQDDGKIVLAGSTGSYGASNFAIVRLNQDGTLDADFASAGIFSHDVNGEFDGLTGVAIDDQGRIVASGTSTVGAASSESVVLRLDADGNFDTGFNGTGINVMSLGFPHESVDDMVLQDDGKIVLTGTSYASAGINDVSVVRLNTDGTLDSSFAGDGTIKQAIGAATDSGDAVAVDRNGNIVITGRADGTTEGSHILRFTATGELDAFTTFSAVNTLDGNPTFVEDGAAVVLDSDVQIFDEELSGVDNFDGASLTLVRNGGADAEDVFSASGTLGTLTEGGNLVVGATTIGAVTTNSGGTLVLTFNTNATNDLVNEAMQQVAYSNSSDAPTASVQIDWTFNDQNAGAQGSGGALTAIGSTTVSITAVNDAPVNNLPGSFSTDEDTTLAFTGANQVQISDVDDAGANVRVQLNVGAGGLLTLGDTTGLSFSAGDGAADANMVFTGTVADINAALLTLTFVPTGDYVGSVNLTMVTNDLGNTGNDPGLTGDGSSEEDSDTVGISINAVNDAPVLTAGTVSNLTVNEDSGLTSLGLGSVSYAPGGGTDESGQTLSYSVSVIPSSANGDIFLADGTTRVTTGAYSLAQIQGMQFKPADDWNGITAFEFRVKDSGGTSNGGSDSISQFILITVNSDNDAPDVDLNGTDGSGSGFATTFVEDGGAVAVADSDAIVSDVDGTSYNSLSLNFNTAPDGSAEQLTVGGYTFTHGVADVVVRTVGSTAFQLDFDGSGFDISRDGGGTIPDADMEALIRGITYENTSDGPTAGNRVLDFLAVDDQGLAGAVAQSTITVTPVDDAPVIGGTDTGTVTEDVDPDVDTLLETSGTLTISDPDPGESSFQAATINGTYGDLTIDTAGNWAYSADNTQAAIQALDVGESVNDVLTVTTADGTTHDVTITINGAEDAPVITGTTTGSVTEDGTLTANGTLAISDTDTSDNPISFPDEASTLGDNGYGDFALTGGTWTYTLNNAHAAVQALDNGESLTDTHTFTASDGSTQLVTVTINGAEDAPVITGTTTGSVTEDGTLTANGTLAISDTDTSDNPISFPDEASTLGDNGYGDFALTGGTWTYTLNNAHAAVQALDNGETLTDTHTFTASDGSTQLVTVTINGAEDAPVITGTTTGSVTEDGTLTANGSLAISDTDTSDNPISFPDEASTLGDNGYGDFALTGGTWTYTLNNAHAAVQALDAGETLTDTHTFTASDGSTQLVTVTINGAEDAPVITGTTTGSVTEDGTLTANGTLAISDTDTSDNPISFPDEASTLGDNGYGDFALTGGTWTYTLNNAHAAVQALDAGETLTDTHTFTASDGSTQLVTVTINGAEDAPVITGTTTGSVTEDGTLTANGTLAISDTDTSDNPISFPDEASTLGDNGYGDFALTGGTWTYTLNNAHAAVQALDAGETLTDTHTFTASDGSTQLVTVTINGAEDAPVIAGTTTGSVTEDGTLSANGILSITDADTSDNPISFPDEGSTLGDNGYGDFALTGGTWTYTLNNSHATVQALGTGESITDTHTFTASDGSTQLVTVTINGAEDAPVITGTTTGAVTEDGTLTANGTLAISDTDTSDNPISFPDEASTLGDNGYGDFALTGGTWTYTLNNAHAAVQALDAGESLTDTHTFTASDGSTQLVTVTINGAEDAPTVANPIGDQIATEDSAFNFTFAANAFDDVDTSDTLTYTATLSDNSALPAWLSFDDTTRTFSGTPTNADVGTISVKVVADDGSSTVFDVFDITVNNTNDAPVIGGVDTGAVTEDVDPDVDTLLEASGALTIADPDIGESNFQAATIVGTYGSLTIDAAGNWDYAADNTQAAIQALDVGESVNDVLTVTTADGTTHDVTITIHGAEDAPVITGTTTGAVTEDGTLTANGALSITDADTSDNPVSFPDAASTAGDNGYGDFALTGGTWTYTLNNAHAAVQALDAGESLTDTHTFTASDGSTQLVTVTINGAEDAPVITGTTTGSVTEDGTLTANGTLAISDTDTSDNPISFPDEGSTLGDNGYGDFTLTGGTWTYTLNNTHAAVQALDAGETLTDTHTFTASDGSTQLVTVTINGAEDAPVITGTTTGSVTEDGTLTANGTLAISDTDTSDNPISFPDAASTAGDNGYGDFALTGGTWTYTLNNAHAAVQALDAGETLTDTHTFTASDGSTQFVTVTINGAEDAPVITGTTTGSVTEDGTLTANGTLSITDADTSDNPVSFPDEPSTLGDNGYGDFALTGGTWTYTLNNTHAAVQALDAGETLTDTHTFTASDGSTQLVTVTINGAEDAPVISGTTTGSVTEDDTLTANGTLAISDVDTSDNPISFPDVASTLGDNGYGDFALTGGTWIYTLDNTHAAVQALDAGEALTDTHTFTASDGSTQLVTVTINGAEDAPVITAAATGSVTEDGTLTANGTLAISDVDTSDNPISFPDAASTLGDNGYGDFALTGGTWIYTLDNTHAAVQALDTGETLTDTHTFTASDGSTQLVTVTINGAEDAPVITGTTTGSVTEDGTLTANGTLAIADTDTSDNPVSFPDAASTAGDNGYGDFALTGGTWTYTLDNAHAAVQALDAGETLTDTHTFTASDGSTQVVSVTVNGAEDAPVITGTTIGAVAEDSTLVTTGTLAISDADTADGPVAFADAASTLGDHGYGDFALTAGTWTYTLNNDHAAVQALNGGETLTDSHTFTASDGSTQTVTVTIDGGAEPEPSDPRPTRASGPELTSAVGPVAVELPVVEAPAPESEDLEPEAEADPSADGQAPVPWPDPVLPAAIEPGDLVLSVLSERTPAPAEGAVEKPTAQSAKGFLQELKALWRPEPPPAEVVEVDFKTAHDGQFWRELEQMSDDLDRSAEETQRQTQLNAEAAAGVSISLTAGFVSWALRAGSLVASFLAAMPTWRNFDPMPILSADEKTRQTPEDDERNLTDDAAEVDKKETTVDELFER